MAVVRVLQDRQFFPGCLLLEKKEFFCKSKKGTFQAGIFFFEVHLVGQGEIEIPWVHFMAYEIYPVAVASFFYQEKEIIVFPVRHEEVFITPEAVAVYFFDLEQAVAILAGLLQGIMWNDRLLPECVQEERIDE